MWIWRGIFPWWKMSCDFFTSLLFKNLRNVISHTYLRSSLSEKVLSGYQFFTNCLFPPDSISISVRRMKVTVDFTQDAAAQFSTMKLILAVMTHGSGFTTLANKLCVAWSNLGMNKQTLISTGRPRQYPDCIGSAFFDASHTTTAWALQV